jgi:cytochrome c-type biogenesis protein CcmH/NrfF
MMHGSTAQETTRFRFWVRWLCLVCGLVALPFGATAQQSAGDEGAGSGSEEPARSPGEVSDIVGELSREIQSPYCPGKTLEMCPSGGASEIRRDIQKMARRGVPKQEIEDRIIEEHGEEYRLEEPPAEDHYPLIALIVAALLVCIVAIYLFTRSQEAPREATDGPDPNDLSDEEEIYLEELRSQYRD